MPAHHYAIPVSTIDRQVARARVVAALAALMPVVLVAVLRARTADAHQLSSWWSQLVLAALLGFALGYYFFWRVKAWRTQMLSYAITVTDDSILVSLPKAGRDRSLDVLDSDERHTRRLHRSDITSIYYYTGNRLIVRAEEPADTVSLSAKLQPFDRLLAQLGEFAPIEHLSGQQLTILRTALSVLSASGLFVALIARTPAFILAGGLVSILGYGYMLWATWRYARREQNQTRRYVSYGACVALALLQMLRAL